ncbi:unnamed protein product [Periconia digitata]|uniref:UBX domain-containing protein n=1 Tax=Periconia digitata TaxID=1303443 RepID=A0A9W4XZ62_9PLEO|nr:unnamed protein product [Periconia digitata]
MSHVTVFNASAKSVRIPTTPTKYLTEVRDEACQKLGMSKDIYTLKYNNKPISLSQQIRLANLAQGARLELVQASRSPTVITVALQLPDQRLTKKLPNNISLWEILRQFESQPGHNFNFTQRGVPEMSSNGASGAGRLNYEMPVITVLPDHKKYATFGELQKTLSQLGFDSGSALLKLSYQNSGTPLEEAMTQITQYFKSSEPAATSGAHAQTASQTASVPNPDARIEDSTATVAGQTTRLNEPDPSSLDVDMDRDNEPSEDAASAPAEPSAETSNAVSTTEAVPSTTTSSPPPPSSTNSRNIQVFAAPTSTTPQAARQSYNEADYVPTVEHAKSHQASLNSRTRNTRLLSDKELADLAQERTQKQTQTQEKGGKIRLRFPDGALVESTITKLDTAATVYDIATSVLDPNLASQPFQLLRRDPDNPVRLAALPRDPKTRLFADAGLGNSEMLTFRWDEAASPQARGTRNVLSAEWQRKAAVLKVEDPVAAPAPAAASGGKGAAGADAKGKRKTEMSSEEKENKLKNILKGGIFGKKK